MIKAILSAFLVGLSLSGCSTSQAKFQDSLHLFESSEKSLAPEGIADAEQSRLRIAHFFLERGHKKTAIALYMQAIEQATTAKDIVAIGERLMSLGALSQAASAFRRAIDIDMENHAAKIGLGLVMLSRGEVAAGIDYFQHLTENPVHFTLTSCQIYGAARDLNANHGEAQKIYRRCLKLEPGHPDIQSNLALSLLLSGSQQVAVNLSRDIVENILSSRVHKRNHVLILALASRRKQALRFGKVSLGSRETFRILRFAESIIAISDPKERARAIGGMFQPKRHIDRAT